MAGDLFKDHVLDRGGGAVVVERDPEEAFAGHRPAVQAALRGRPVLPQGRQSVEVVGVEHFVLPHQPHRDGVRLRLPVPLGEKVS